MINKQPSQVDQPDSPPPYDYPENSTRASLRRIQDTKQAVLEPVTGVTQDNALGAAGTSSSLRSPLPLPPPTASVLSTGISGLASLTGYIFSPFNSTGHSSANDIRTTVKALISQIVCEEHATRESEQAALHVLRSCHGVCGKKLGGAGVELGDVLREMYIGEHTPIYWAILHRRMEGERMPRILSGVDEVKEGDNTTPTSFPDLITALLHYARPLTPLTIHDILLALLPNSDQLLYQQLQLYSPDEFRCLSEVDKILLKDGPEGRAHGGMYGWVDRVRVGDVRGSSVGEFIADVEVAQFQKRMRVAKRAEVGFVARSRVWKLALWVVPDTARSWAHPKPGSWCISLSLLASTSATHVDARAIIESHTTTGEEHCPPLIFELKSDKKLASIPPNARRLPHGMEKDITAEMDNNPLAISLQYTGTPYIAADEVLRFRLEAMLTKVGR